MWSIFIAIGLLPLVAWGIYISWRHENKSIRKAIEKAIEEVEEQPKEPETIISSDPITVEEIIAFFNKNGCKPHTSLSNIEAYTSHNSKNDITIYLYFIDTENAFLVFILEWNI